MEHCKKVLKNMRVIFCCSLKNKPYGGIDQIIKNSIILNKLNFKSLIFDFKRNNILKFFFYKTPERYIKSDLYFIKNISEIRSDDFLIIPEIYVSKFAPICIKNKIRFAILIQGPFLIKIDDIKYYQSAFFLIAVSKFIKKYIENFIPYKKNIIDLLISPTISHKELKKNKVITYMPRKLNNHINLFLYDLNNSLPKNWKLLAIDNKTNDEVIQILQRSSIFLSLSDLEGFGLPSLEAGLCGNLVIGYDGQGSKEYFKSPQFIKIDYGDLDKLKKTIFKSIKLIEDGYLLSLKIRKSIEQLKSAYSRENEIYKLRELIENIKESYSRDHY